MKQKVFLRTTTLVLGWLVAVSCTPRAATDLDQAGMQCQLAWGGAQVDPSRCALNVNQQEDASEIKFKTPHWNPKKQNIYVEFVVKPVTSLKGLQFRFFSKDERRYSYELPLYSDPEYSLLKSGEALSISLPLSQMQVTQPGEVDGASLYVSTQANASLQVLLKRVWVKDKTERAGVVSITFDDGFASNHLAGQIAKDFGFAGTAYLIPKAFGTPGYVTLAEVKDLKQWGWDVASHHEKAVTGLSKKERSELLWNVQKNLEYEFESEAVGHFAYPMGKHDQKAIGELKAKLKSGRLAGGGFETLPPADLYRLRVINVTPGRSADELFAQAQAASVNGDWAIFMFHTLDNPAKGDLDYSSENFKSFLQKLKKNKISVKTVDQIL